MGFVVDFNLQKFRKVRKSKMTAQELADRVGIKKYTIDAIENGRRKATTEEEYRKLCEAIEEPYEQFIGNIVKTPKVITILTNKGGAGKSTATVNIAGTLVHEFNKKVLVIDTDLQQNTTMNLGMLYPIDETDSEEVDRINFVREFCKDHNIYNAFKNGDDIQQHICKTKWDNLDIVMSCDEMALIEDEISRIQLRELRMQDVLNNIITTNPNEYDYIIIDCNPMLSTFNESMLFASDFLIIPLECTMFGLQGVEYVFNFYERVHRRRNNLHILGILLNRVDMRRKVTRIVTEAIHNDEAYNSLLFETVLPEDASVAQAQLLNEPLFASFGKTSKKPRIYDAYINLTEEIIDRINSYE